MTLHEDWISVCEVRSAFAAGLDGCDWPLLRSVLADSVLVDYSSWSGRPAATVEADEWVEQRTLLFPGLAASQHSLTNPRVVIDGDGATSTVYVTSEHVLDPDGERWFTIGGVYDDELVRTPDGWRISSMRLLVRWQRGDRGVIDEARRRARSLDDERRRAPRPR